MARYLQSITHHGTTWHLSTNGRDVFQSRFYMTGGVIFPELAVRNGRIVDRHTRKLLGDEDLTNLLAGDEAVTRSMWETVVECCRGVLAPLFRRRREVRWNLLLG